MKKIIGILFMVAVFSVPAMVMADDNAVGFNEVKKQGGYTGPIATISVMEALELRDDAGVVLEGYIVRSIGGEKYEFKDKTGSVTIEIDDDYNWQGQSVGPEDLVVIFGEVDRDFREFKIDVDRVEKK